MIKTFCADSTKFTINIPNDFFDLIILDPPYLTTNEKWDKQDVINEAFVKELYRVSKVSASIYVWCGIGEKSQSLIRWFPIFSNVFHFKDLITWKKQRGIGMRKGWLYTREEIMWLVKDNHKFIWNKEHQYTNEKRVYTPNPEKCHSKYKRITNVWININESSLQGSMGAKQFKGHYTPKPIEAIEQIIKVHTISSNSDEIIFDPFGGSGTTAIAAMNLNKECIIIEKDEEIYDKMYARIFEHAI